MRVKNLLYIAEIHNGRVMVGVVLYFSSTYTFLLFISEDIGRARGDSAHIL